MSAHVSRVTVAGVINKIYWSGLKFSFLCPRHCRKPPGCHVTSSCDGAGEQEAMLSLRDCKGGLFIKIPGLYLSRFKICRFMISFVAEILRSVIGREQRSIIIKLLKHSPKNYTQLLHLSSWSSLVNKINK